MVTARTATATGVVAAAAVAALSLIGPSEATSACRAKKKARAVLRNVDGEKLGIVEFWQDGTCTTRVTAKIGQFNLQGEESGLSEGFHGFHIHSTGKCEPEAVDADDQPSPFFTAGAHWNPNDRDHGNHHGDLPPLLATTGGLARANVLTDRFTVNRLFDGDGSAVIVHADPDNLAHIPATDSAGEDRYHSHLTDEMGADEPTRATGDGGSRFACGVIRKL